MKISGYKVLFGPKIVKLRTYGTGFEPTRNITKKCVLQIIKVLSSSIGDAPRPKWKLQKVLSLRDFPNLPRPLKKIFHHKLRDKDSAERHRAARIESHAPAIAEWFAFWSLEWRDDVTKLKKLIDEKIFLHFPFFASDEKWMWIVRRKAQKPPDAHS